MMTHYMDTIRQLYLLSPKEAYGCPATTLAAAEQKSGFLLPAALRAYYLALGTNEAINQAHNHLLLPDDIYRSDNGYLVFYEENQGVAVWGIKEEDLLLPNPPVYGSYDTGQEEWFPDADTTEKFLLAMAYWNAALGGLYYTAFTEAPENITVQVLEQLTKTWTEQKNLTSQYLLFFTQEANVIMVMTTSADGEVNGIFLASNEQQAFEHVMQQTIIAWDYRSDQHD